MDYTEQSKPERISIVLQSLKNAQSNEDLASRLAIRTYTAERIQVGLNLATTAQSLYEKQLKEYGESFRATAVYSDAGKTLREEMRVFRGIGRVLFKSDKLALNNLNLNESIERGFAGFRSQTEATLNNAISTPEILEMCTSFGFPLETLTGMKERLNKLPELKTTRDNERNEAQEATRDWDAVMDDMDEWYSDFITIARYAVVDRPELMELLGVVVPS